VALNCDDCPVGAQSELAADRLDNSGICLMRNEPVDVGPAQPVGGQRFIDDRGQMRYRLPKHFSAFHAQATGGSGRGRATIDIENVVFATIGMQRIGQNAAIG